MTRIDTLAAAVVSTDEDFRSGFREPAVRREIEVILELAIPIPDVSAGHLEELKERSPDLVFLDLEDDPELGCRLAQHVTEALPGRRLIAAGPMLSQELLLKAMQSGVAEYLTKPVTAESIQEVVTRSRRTLVPREAPRKPVGKVLAFFSPKGGGGATTVATNLAIQLHRLTGKRTIVVDLDLELGECAAFLGLQPQYNVLDVAANLHRVDEGLLASFVESHESGVQLLAAPYHPERADEVTVDQVVRILRLLRHHYDYVVVDCPKALTARTIKTFEQADQVFLVAQMNVPNIQNLQRAEPLLARLRGNGRRVRLIVNRYDPAVEITLEDIERSLGMEVYWTLGNDYEVVSHSMNTGKPLIMRAGSVSARELEGLAAKITGTTESRTGSRGKLFGSIFGRFKDRLSATSPAEAYMLPPLTTGGEGR